MGCCCQNSQKPDNNKEFNIQNANASHISDNLLALQELYEQFSYKQKHIAMLIDKLDLEIQLSISKNNENEALFVFKRKTLFTDFERQIDNYIQILKNEMESPKKLKSREQINILADFLNEVQDCSDLNYRISDNQYYSNQEREEMKLHFESMFENHLKLKSREIETMYKNYATDFRNKRSSSPLFKKKKDFEG